MPRLSALVRAHTEEKRLAACLESLSFADELVVMPHRRTAGAEACTGDWILEIDADELVGVALAEEIRDTVNSAIEPAHFLIPIDHCAGHRLIRQDAETRLYRRGAKLIGLGGGRLVNPLFHRVEDELSDRLRRLFSVLHVRPMPNHQAAE